VLIIVRLCEPEEVKRSTASLHRHFHTTSDGLMPSRDTDEEFEFLLNLLASDGIDSEPPPGATSSRRDNVDRGFKIQRGSDGKLDLDQVKGFYENKTMKMGARDSPVLTDHSRSRSGGGVVDAGLVLEGDITVSRSVSDREDQTGSPPSVPPTPAPQGGDSPNDFQRRSRTPASPASIDASGRWVDLLSEQEAKQLLLEISDALKLKLPLDEDPRSATDQPRTLGEIKNVVEFLVKMDELVWRRSEHGANRGVFDSKNISAVEERIRLWEGIARGCCAE